MQSLISIIIITTTVLNLVFLHNISIVFLIQVPICSTINYFRLSFDASRHFKFSRGLKFE